MTGTPSDSIDRREAIRRAALLLGGALSASTVAGILAGCDTPAATPGDWKPRALDGDQLELVATLSEHILPQTDTPGARAANVHRFIDTMLAGYYPPRERDRFISGLRAVDTSARKACGRSFVQCTPDQQRALLTAMDREAFAPRPRRPAANPSKETERGAGATPPSDDADTIRQAPARAATVPFFRTLKELTVVGYYTSEIGATRELRYERVPDRFEGCVPFTTVGRTWAV